MSGNSARMTLGAQAGVEPSSVVPVLPTLATRSAAPVSRAEVAKARHAQDSTSAADDPELVAISSARGTADGGKTVGSTGRALSDDTGDGEEQLAALKFELTATGEVSRNNPAAVVAEASALPSTSITTLPAASKTHCRGSSDDVDDIAGDGARRGSDSRMAAAPRARRGADHLVDKLVGHLDPVEVNDEAANVTGCFPMVVRAHDIHNVPIPYKKGLQTGPR